MGFTKICRKWLSKDGDQGGSSSAAQAKNEGEEQADVAGDKAGADAYNAGDAGAFKFKQNITSKPGICLYQIGEIVEHRL
ncbi:hypothetical protein VNO80_15708 [Phaseolus coccineus]|uniref:Uncharacterized protein n=1 Tax=Phaseolus coccineus TaxID=3886 RepID=A0AAN9R2J1_PHACN